VTVCTQCSECQRGEIQKTRVKGGRNYDSLKSLTAFFEGGWVTLSADFRGKGALPTNHCWCQKTTVIAVSCGIKIFAVCCSFVTIHASDRQTDGRTDGQNSDSNTVRCITCSRTVKMIYLAVKTTS